MNGLRVKTRDELEDERILEEGPHAQPFDAGKWARWYWAKVKQTLRQCPTTQHRLDTDALCGDLPYAAVKSDAVIAEILKFDDYDDVSQVWFDQYHNPLFDFAYLRSQP